MINMTHYANKPVEWFHLKYDKLVRLLTPLDISSQSVLYITDKNCEESSQLRFWIIIMITKMIKNGMINQIAPPYSVDELFS